jgi:hypothetical protein
MSTSLLSRWRLRGVGLLELGLGLGILGLALGSSLRELDYQAQDAKAHAAADDLAQASAASKEYMRIFRAELLGAAAVGGNALGIQVARRLPNTAIPSGPPEAPNLPSVQGGGFLPSSYVDRNPYQAHHVLYVRQPVAGTLEGIVSARGGQDVPDRALARIMSRLGAPGGAVLNRPASGDLSKLQGTGGAWEISAADRSLWAYNSGTYIESRRPVYNLGMGTQSPLEDYIYRNNIGIPEANTMRTALNMANRNINNAATVNANVMTLQNGGNACAGDVTGCTFWISNEGGFRDNNNGWIQFIGNFGDNSDPGVERGLYIGGGPGNNLFVEGSSRVRGTLSIAEATYLYNDLNIGGNLRVARDGRFLGRVGVMADPDDVPLGWQGGVRTVDLVASASVAVMNSGTLPSRIGWSGDVNAGRDGLFGRNVRIGGSVTTNGYNPANLPSGSPGGVRTWDVVASWGAYVMNADSSAPVTGMSRSGDNFGKLVTTNYSEVGSNCAEDGQIGRSNASGSMLWCQGGIWVDIKSRMGKITWVSGNSGGCEPGYYHWSTWAWAGRRNTNNSVIHQCIRNGF